MRLRIVALQALLFLFLPLTLHAQNQCAQIGQGHQMCTNYGVTPSISFVDNTATAKSQSVWHLGAYTLSVVRGGAFFVAGLNSSGQIVTYNDYPTNTWTVQTGWGSGYTDLAVGNANAICTIGAWNGSTNRYCLNSARTAMVPTSAGASTRIAAGQDGYICTANSAYNLWCSADGGQTWTDLDTGSVAIPVVASTALVYFINTSGTLWRHPLSGSDIWVAANVKDAGIDADGRVYYVGTDTYVYRMNDSGAFDKLAGSGFTSVGNGGSMHVLATGPTQSGSDVYRFPDQAMTFTAIMTGNTTCNDGNGHQMTCPTTTHVPTVVAKFGKYSVSGGQTVTGPGVPPETQVNVQAMDTTFDPFECLDNGFDSIGCLGYSGQGPVPNVGSIVCTIAGLIFQEHFPIPLAGGFKLVTHIRLSGPPSNCHTSVFGAEWCWYPVAASYPASCPNPGPYIFTDAEIIARTDVVEAPPPGGPIKYWKALAECFKFQDTGWSCIPLGSLPRVVKPADYCDTLSE